MPEASKVNRVDDVNTGFEVTKIKLSNFTQE